MKMDDYDYHDNEKMLLILMLMLTKTHQQQGKLMNLVFMMKNSTVVVPRHLLRRLTMVYNPSDNTVSACWWASSTKLMMLANTMRVRNKALILLDRTKPWPCIYRHVHTYAKFL